jgi:nicotinic acid mononucleotide adenylyltransferase
LCFQLIHLINFHLWYQWREIINLVKIAVFERKDYIKAAKNSEATIFCDELFKKTGEKRLIFVKNQKYNISSTQIRNKND